MEREQDAVIEVEGGPRLEARLGLPASPRGGLVVCHPHPLYGGDMDNPVVVRAVEVATETGLATVRFNFRGVGCSTGTHARGVGEGDDVTSALSMLRARLPSGTRIGLAGYSFGAWVAARVAESQFPLAGLCLIAPPLSMFDFAALDGSVRDTLVVAGTRDTYCPTGALAALAEHAPAVHVETVDGADHFFFGKLFPLGELVRGWAARWTSDR